MARSAVLPALALALVPVGQGALAQAPAAVSQAADLPYDLIVHAGQFIAIAGEALRGPTTIAVRGGRIVEVRGGLCRTARKTHFRPERQNRAARAD